MPVIRATCDKCKKERIPVFQTYPYALRHCQKCLTDEFEKFKY